MSGKQERHCPGLQSSEKNGVLNVLLTNYRVLSVVMGEVLGLRVYSGGT